MTKHLFSLVLIFILFTLPVRVFAIKAYPYPMSITQPDGKSITVRLNGDEFHHYYSTEDGYLIQKNTKGFFVYSAIESEELVARNASSRSKREISLLQSAAEANYSTLKKQRAAAVSNNPNRANRAVNNGFPLNGSPKSLVILVNFKDTVFVTPNAKIAFTNLLNEQGYAANGGTGSARDYFKSASYGQFSPEFDVVGPYTLPQNMKYYGENDSYDEDKNPRQMVIDACTLANNNGLDFTQYDTDNDGILDNVFIYYAGHNEAEGAEANTVWPHRWALANYNTKFDGKSVYDYACTSELKGLSGTNMCGIGTFCHEFGHVLGLPDYYHTEKDADTLNDWSIMDSGAYLNQGRTPPTYSVFDRFFLGWLTPTEINSASNQVLLPIYQGVTPPVNTNQQAYILSATTHNLIGSNPNPKEFFMLEYRKKVGWDKYLPKEGMLIWHVDYNQTAWDNNSPNNYTGTNQSASSHMRMYLQPLVDSKITPGTAFTSGSFTPTTWSGVNIDRALTDISKTTDNISFKLMGGLMTGISITGTVNQFSTLTGTASALQSVTVSGASLTNDMLIGFNQDDHFEMKLSTESNWSKSLTLSPISGVISQTLHLRYNPLNAGSHTAQLLISSIGVDSKSIAVQGSSTAPYIPGTPLVIVGNIDNTLVFPSIKVNSNKTKVLNVKTTDLVGSLTLAVSGENAAMFTVSVSSVTKENANAQSGSNINITYKPTAVGAHSATLTISGGGLNPAKVIQLSGEGL